MIRKSNMTIEEKEQFIKEKKQEIEDNYRKQEKMAAKQITVILKEGKFSLAQIEWIFHYVKEEIRNTPLGFQ